MAEFRPTVEQLIRDYLAGEDYTPLKQHELAKALHIKGSARRDFRNTLYQLERSGQVIRLRKNRWAIPDQSQQVTGFLEVNSKGFGFVRPLAADSEDIFIPGDSMGLAIHGDKVIVSVTRSHAEKRRRRRPDAPPLKEGRVVGVVERSREQLAGILMRSQFYWYVIPDDHRIMHEVRIADAGTLKPEECERHKVVVRLLSPGTGSRFLEGVLTEDLGPADSPGIEILSLMRNYGLTDSFPAAVESAALSVETEPGQTGLDGRVDLRGMLTFTIDPEDAKDFDDAVSLERSPSGEWILWVHIADVAHFVPVGSSIDEEAFNRGTSVYLVDRVISMLPRHLTRDVCSLQPEKDRLTRTVEIRLSSEGDVLEEKTYLSVIRSRQRLTYDEVQLLFDQRACDNVEADIQTSLAQMRLLAAQLRRQRMNNGAITFDLAEVKCLLDSSGKPTAIVRRGAREAYNLIEEFMLLANQAVARMLSSGDRPGIYRIHPPPDEKDWEEMSSDLTKLGISAQPENQHDMNRLAAESADTPIGYSVTLAILRNMKRAYYSPVRADHFGLAFTHYTHFTSPIRRYPDLVVHRILKSIEDNARPPHSKEDIRDIAEHCSMMERQADEAERESIDIKRVEYYQNCLWSGRTGPYKATVVSIAGRGLIVELRDSLQRGMIAYSSLTDDYYAVDRDHGTVTGRRHGRRFGLGDVLDVELERVDSARRFVDFRLDMPAPRRRRGRKRRTT